MDFEPMDTSEKNTSPKTDQKIKARNAAMRLKHGSPQLKDVLRKRFRERIKDSRGRLFDDLRSMDATKSNTIPTLIQDELSRILEAEDWNSIDYEEEERLREKIETEASSEQENWLMQQYDLLMADDNILQQLWEETQMVVCPVCLKGNLKFHCEMSSKVIRCGCCRLVVPARASLDEIQDQIHAVINCHSGTGCLDEPRFFVSCEDASLYGHCNSCSFLDLVV